MAEPTTLPGQGPEPDAGGSGAASAAGEAAQAPDRSAPTPVKAAGKAVRALTHAASSFLLYDATNEAVAGFISDLRESLDQFLTAFGRLELEIRPWDMTFAGQVVYLDRDRERSMAFRLYKDGVRKLVIHPEVTWEEIIELLGILAVRARGIRQHEDDVVTMLWNASFKHIETEVVEGLVAEDDERVAEVVHETDAAVAPRSALQAMVFNAPYLFDYPVPPVGDRGPVAYRPLPEASFERIRRQDGPEGLPLECAQLTAELLALLNDEFDPLSADDVVPLLREVRAYLLGNGLLRPFAQILRLVGEKAPPDETLRGQLLAAVADGEVLRRLLDLAGERRELSIEELGEIAGLVPGDHVPIILDFLATHPDGPGRQLGILLLEQEARTRPERISQRLLANREAADLELLRMLERVNQPAAEAAALDLLAARAPAVQIAALAVLARTPYSAKIGRALVGALRSSAEEVRRKALDALVAQKERRAYDTLVEQFKTMAAGAMSLGEAGAIGEAMARLEPERARKQLSEWVRPPGLLGRLASVPLPLRWGAVAGLVVLGGDDARELIEWLAGKSSGDLQQLCRAGLQALAVREGRQQR
ncbi:MAG TPA: hypothetical protein P5234_09560 [Thermoanaerobaculaceae bacterium]|nr:hypothetical protein [Thermoanaerobaculaceae bacterium]HRS16477.1 hypothetical protein [Thermoanaerobaculaceae bacterium]